MLQSKIINDDKYLVCAGDNKTVNVWDFYKKNLEVKFKGHTNRVTCLDVSSDGKYVVSGSWDGSVRLWNIIDKVPVAVLLKNSSGSFPELNINGYDIIGGDDCSIRIWMMKHEKKF